MGRVDEQSGTWVEEDTSDTLVDSRNGSGCGWWWCNRVAQRWTALDRLAPRRHNDTDPVHIRIGQFEPVRTNTDCRCRRCRRAASWNWVPCPKRDGADVWGEHRLQYRSDSPRHCRRIDLSLSALWIDIDQRQSNPLLVVLVLVLVVVLSSSSVLLLLRFGHRCEMLAEDDGWYRQPRWMWQRGH